ncbi:HD domain-containing protein [Zooshikella sp. RANM57]|uniref:HD domain-containing protein n=1 Tax=Zooshikella sp. RANM57 TaxID=3425863 RepID=UPI003D6E5C33
MSADSISSQLLHHPVIRKLYGTWRQSLYAAKAECDHQTQYEVFAHLISQYQQPHRHYHTIYHLAHLITLAERFAHLCQDLPSIILTIFYHDSVYKRFSKKNEIESAKQAAQALPLLGVDTTHIEKISQWILATEQHQPSSNSKDEQFFLDLDLAILATPEALYRRYQQQVRMEHRYIPLWLYRRLRNKVLSRLISRPTLYFTPTLQSRWEEQARINIRQEILGERATTSDYKECGI